jgi:hypothetical protein
VVRGKRQVVRMRAWPELLRRALMGRRHVDDPLRSSRSPCDVRKPKNRFRYLYPPKMDNKHTSDNVGNEHAHLGDLVWLCMLKISPNANSSVSRKISVTESRVLSRTPGGFMCRFWPTAPSAGPHVGGPAVALASGATCAPSGAGSGPSPAISNDRLCDVMITRENVITASRAPPPK